MKRIWSYKIIGVNLPVFLIFVLVIVGVIAFDLLPKGLVGALSVMIVFGAIFNELGNNTPIIKDFLGGGPILIIFGASALVTYIPHLNTPKEIISDFMRDGGFLNFYIAALITGSILGMNRTLLIRAAIRYLPTILGGVVLAFSFVFIFAEIIGYGGDKALLFIAVPIMGGGMGAGAVPIAQIFGETTGIDSKNLLSVMVPALALGNAIAIVLAGLLDKLGKVKKSLTGNGQLMRREMKIDVSPREDKSSFQYLGIGLVLSLVALLLGELISIVLPLHPFAITIILVAVLKVSGIFPEIYEEAAHQWFRFIMVLFTPALLIGIGVAYTDLNIVIEALTPTYVALISITIVGAVLGAGFVGHLMGFYFVEAAITAGLCMANMGGTGDIAVLSASKRMELMPFAQISSRIGGAFLLILATVLISFLNF